MFLLKQQLFHSFLAIHTGSVFDKQSEISRNKQIYPWKINSVLVHEEPPRDRNKLKILHFFNNFPYKVTEPKSWCFFQFHFTLPSLTPMPHFYIFYLFKDPPRNMFTYSYSFIFVTCNYHSGHFLACAYFHSTPLSFFPPRRSVALLF